MTSPRTFVNSAIATRMSSAIHSRATGRSGPKTKTGCSTCRRRKVRCDEGQPICANCIRLNISCGFADSRSQTGRISQRPPRLRHPTPGSAPQQEANHGSTGVPGRVGVEDLLYNAPATDDPAFAASDLQNDNGPSLQSSTSQQPSRAADTSLDQYGIGTNFPETLAFQDVFISSINSTEMSSGYTESFQLPHTPNHLPWLTPLSQLSEGDRPSDQTAPDLLEHFTEASNPIAVIVPTHLEWTTACRTLLSMAQNSPPLLAAICAHSGLHLYSCNKDHNMLDIAFSHYQSSSNKVTLFFEEDSQTKAKHARTGSSELKQIFAAVFLLSHIELTAQSTPMAPIWPLQHVHTAHARVRQHSDSIKTWAGTSRRLLTWMTLLQNKAEYNGGTPSASGRDEDGLERCSSTSSMGGPSADDATDQRPDRSISSQSNHSPKVWATVSEESPTPAEILGEMINQPALEFHLRAQGFTPRIIALDKHHHKRGTLESDFAILKQGHVINSNLHSLWEERPAIFSLLEDSTGMSNVLQPSYSHTVLRSLRVYSANFWAHYIYLHRVAFVAYPATEDVNRAVSQIGTLAKALEADLGQTRDGNHQAHYQNSPLSPSHDDMHLPHSMFWPLFMLCLECPAQGRDQFLDMMRQICCLPNIDKGVLLLEEVLRRQDRAGVRIDHRDVRKELFNSELSVIY